MALPNMLPCTHPRTTATTIHHQTHHTTCTYNANNPHFTSHSHTLMPANLHFFAHAKHVLSPLPHTHSKHTTRLALHCIVPTKHSHPLHIHPPKTHLRPSPPTITASPHTARHLMARSLTHYVLQMRQQWHMSQRPRDRCTALITDAIVPQAAMYTPTHNSHYHSSPNPPHAMYIQRTQSTPHHTLPHAQAQCPPYVRLTSSTTAQHP